MPSTSLSTCISYDKYLHQHKFTHILLGFGSFARRVDYIDAVEILLESWTSEQVACWYNYSSWQYWDSCLGRIVPFSVAWCRRYPEWDVPSHSSSTRRQCFWRLPWSDWKLMIAAVVLDGLFLRALPTAIFCIPLYIMADLNSGLKQTALFFCLTATFAIAIGALSMAVATGQPPERFLSHLLNTAPSWTAWHMSTLALTFNLRLAAPCKMRKVSSDHDL